MMTRRSLLRFLALVPVVGPAAVKAMMVLPPPAGTIAATGALTIADVERAIAAFSAQDWRPTSTLILSQRRPVNYRLRARQELREWSRTEGQRIFDDAIFDALDRP